MKKQQHNARAILQRYIQGQCTEEERMWVEEWYKNNYDTEFKIDTALAEEHFAEVWNALEDNVIRKKTVSFKKIAAIAASISIVLGIGSFYLWKSSSQQEAEQVVVQEAQSQIEAGRDQALLTLADGRTIDLDNVAVGEYVTENGIIITKMDDGTLSYKANADQVQRVADVYNTISTPRGGQYKVILPDNSVVWLNAASSLRFPVAFAGNTRAVELEGEGYFEVAHDKRKPFIVTSQNQQTIVKGTKFNIAAYASDKEMVTTLVEGSVLVRAMNNHRDGIDEILLRPNEQVVMNNNVMTKSNVDPTQAIAWKDGKFIFNNTPLSRIMQQLSRWYDVEVQYLDAVDNITFTGSVSRFDDIQDVLRKISLTESVRFETKERRVMVRR